MAFDILKSGAGKSYNCFFKNFTWRAHPHNSILFCRISKRKLIQFSIRVYFEEENHSDRFFCIKKDSSKFSMCIFDTTYSRTYTHMLEHVAVTMMIMICNNLWTNIRIIIDLKITELLVSTNFNLFRYRWFGNIRFLSKVCVYVEYVSDKDENIPRRPPNATPFYWCAYYSKWNVKKESTITTRQTYKWTSDVHNQLYSSLWRRYVSMSMSMVMSMYIFMWVSNFALNGESFKYWHAILNERRMRSFIYSTEV